MILRKDSGKSKWVGQKKRLAVIILAAGIFVELAVVVSGTVLRQLPHLYNVFQIEETVYHNLFVINSVCGFGGSLLLCLGTLYIVKQFQVSKPAVKWAYIASISFMLYRGFDIVQSLHWLYLTDRFGLKFEVDVLISNLLLVQSGLAVVLAMIRALYDLHQVTLTLSVRNADLDREIQEHRKSEMRTQAGEQKLSVIVNAIHSPLFLVNRDGHILAHNQRLPVFLGSREFLLVGKSLCELVSEALFKEGEKHALKAIEENRPAKFIVSHKNHLWETNIYPVMESNGAVDCITVVITDITARIREEEERRLLETAITSAAECIIITDAEGRIEYVNPAFEEQTGYIRYEVMGRTPSILKSGKHGPDHYRELWQTIKRGDIWRGNFINRAKDGSLFREIATISPIRNTEGAISHFVAVKRNITREFTLENQLRQSQKIDALGMLASGISHNLKNTLGVILCQTELVRETLESSCETSMQYSNMFC